MNCRLMVSPSGHAPHQTDASAVTFTRSIIVTGSTFVIVNERERGFTVGVGALVCALISFTELASDTGERVGSGVSSWFPDR